MAFHGGNVDPKEAKKQSEAAIRNAAAAAQARIIAEINANRTRTTTQLAANRKSRDTQTSSLNSSYSGFNADLVAQGVNTSGLRAQQTLDLNAIASSALRSDQFINDSSRGLDQDAYSQSLAVGVGTSGSIGQLEVNYNKYLQAVAEAEKARAAAAAAAASRRRSSGGGGGGYSRGGGGGDDEVYTQGDIKAIAQRNERLDYQTGDFKRGFMSKIKSPRVKRAYQKAFRQITKRYDKIYRRQQQGKNTTALGQRILDAGRPTFFDNQGEIQGRAERIVGHALNDNEERFTKFGNRRSNAARNDRLNRTYLEGRGLIVSREDYGAPPRNKTYDEIVKARLNSPRAKEAERVQAGIRKTTQDQQLYSMVLASVRPNGPPLAGEKLTPDQDAKLKQTLEDLGRGDLYRGNPVVFGPQIPTSSAPPSFDVVGPDGPGEFYDPDAGYDATGQTAGALFLARYGKGGAVSAGRSIRRGYRNLNLGNPLNGLEGLGNNVRGWFS